MRLSRLVLRNVGNKFNGVKPKTTSTSFLPTSNFVLKGDLSKKVGTKTSLANTVTRMYSTSSSTLKLLMEVSEEDLSNLMKRKHLADQTNALLSAENFDKKNAEITITRAIEKMRDNPDTTWQEQFFDIIVDPNFLAQWASSLSKDQVARREYILDTFVAKVKQLDASAVTNAMIRVLVNYAIANRPIPEFNKFLFTIMATNVTLDKNVLGKALKIFENGAMEAVAIRFIYLFGKNNHRALVNTAINLENQGLQVAKSLVLYGHPLINLVAINSVMTMEPFFREGLLSVENDGVQTKRIPLGTQLENYFTDKPQQDAVKALEYRFPDLQTKINNLISTFKRQDQTKCEEDDVIRVTSHVGC